MDQLDIDAKNAVTSEAVDAAWELAHPGYSPSADPGAYAFLAGTLRRAAPHIVREYLSRNCDCGYQRR